MRYNEKDIRTRVEQARKEKLKLDEHHQSKEKNKLFEKMEVKRQNEHVQKKRTISLDKKKKLLIGIISSGLAAAITVSCIAYLGMIYVNSGKCVCKESNSQTDSILSDSAQEFTDVANYLRNVVQEDGDDIGSTLNRFWSSKASPDFRKYGNEILNSIRNSNFKVSTIQIDRSTGCFYVMCDFSGRGNYYFIVEKQDNAYRLLSVDFFS